MAGAESDRSDSDVHRISNWAVALGVSIGVAAVTEGAMVIRKRLVVPDDLANERIKTFKKGAVMLTAGALALAGGEQLTFDEIEERTRLTRQNASWGVNFLEFRGLADRESVGAGHAVDRIAANETLLSAALRPDEFPHLQVGIRKVAEHILKG